MLEPSSEPYALIAVDVQYDFLPGGVLGVPGGDKILRPLVQWAEDATVRIGSRDWHPENHFSFSDHPAYTDGSWPPHCIQGTRGAKIHPAIRKKLDFVVSKGTNRNPPDAYSAFVGKTSRPVRTLEEVLQDFPINTVVVGGLALDWCVRYTAFDASALGYRTIVPLALTEPLDKSKENLNDLVRQFEKAGVEIA